MLWGDSLDANIWYNDLSVQLVCNCVFYSFICVSGGVCGFHWLSCNRRRNIISWLDQRLDPGKNGLPRLVWRLWWVCGNPAMSWTLWWTSALNLLVWKLKCWFPAGTRYQLDLNRNRLRKWWFTEKNFHVSLSEETFKELKTSKSHAELGVYSLTGLDCRTSAVLQRVTIG